MWELQVLSLRALLCPGQKDCLVARLRLGQEDEIEVQSLPTQRDDDNDIVWKEHIPNIIFSSENIRTECLAITIEKNTQKKVATASIALSSIKNKVQEVQLLFEDGTECILEIEFSCLWNRAYNFFQADVRPSKAPNLLKVAIIRARNLTTAAQAVAHLKMSGDTRTFQTQSFPRKSMRPLWLETFDIHIEPGAPSRYLQIDVLQAETTITTRLLLSEMLEKSNQRAWYDLEPKIIRTEASTEKKLNQAATPTTTQRHLMKKASSRFFGLASSTRKVMTQPQIEIATSWIYAPELEAFKDEPVDTKLECNELCISVVQARGLCAHDTNALKQATSFYPFVKLSIKDKTMPPKYHTTKPIPQTLEPWWNTTFRLPVSQKAIQDQSQSLEISIEDYDRYARSNAIIGKIELSLDQLKPNQCIRKWLSLEDKSNCNIHSIDGTPLCVSPHTTTDHNDSTETQFKLPSNPSAHWRRIPNTLSSTMSFRQRSKKQHTTVAPESPPPEEDFDDDHATSQQQRSSRSLFSKGLLPSSRRIFVSSAMKKDELIKNNKTHSVKSLSSSSSSKRMSSARSLSKRLIPSSLSFRSNASASSKRNILSTSSRKFLGPMWRSVSSRRAKKKDCGEIELIFKLTRNCALDHFDSENGTRFPGKEPNQLQITVVSARKLLAKKESIFTASSLDPYIILNCDSRTRKTSIKKRTQAPLFNENFSIPLYLNNSTGFFNFMDNSVNDDKTATLLHVEVHDSQFKNASDNFMGNCTIDLKPLLNRQVSRTWFTLYDKDGPPALPRFADAAYDNRNQDTSSYLTLPEKQSPSTPRRLGSFKRNTSSRTQKGYGEIELLLQMIYNPDLDLVSSVDKVSKSQSKSRPNRLRVALLNSRNNELPLTATMVCGGASLSSSPARTMKKCSEWDHCFEMPVEDSGNNFYIYLHKENELKKDYIGRCAIALKRIQTGKVHRGWLTLQDKSAKSIKEEIQILAIWDHDPRLDFFSDSLEYDDSRSTTLKIAIMAGWNLLPTTRVSARLGDNVAVSDVARKVFGSRAPVWYQTLILPTHQQDKEDKVLKLTVSDLEHRVMTSGELDLSEYRENNKRYRLQLALENESYLDLVLCWEADPIYNFGLDTRYPHLEPNEFGFATCQLRRRDLIEYVKARSNDAIQDTDEWRIVARISPEIVFSSSNIILDNDHPIALLAEEQLLKPLNTIKSQNDSIIHIEIERCPLAQKNKGKKKGQIVATGQLPLGDMLANRSKAKTIRGFIQLECKGNKALRKVQKQGKDYLGNILQLECAAWIHFNASQGCFVHTLESETYHKLHQNWFNRNSAVIPKYCNNKIILVPAQMSLARAPRLGDPKRFGLLEKCMQESGRQAGRVRRASAPQPALYSKGSMLRKFPVVAFPGSERIHSCQMLASSVARIERALDSIRVDTWPSGYCKQKNYLPCRGGEWHERYQARYSDGSMIFIACARLHRLRNDDIALRKREIASEVARLCRLTAEKSDYIVLPRLTSFVGGRSFASLYIPLRAWIQLDDFALGGRGPLYQSKDRDSTAHGLLSILHQMAQALDHAHTALCLHGGFGSTAIVVDTTDTDRLFAQLTDFELSSDLLLVSACSDDDDDDDETPVHKKIRRRSSLLVPLTKDPDGAPVRKGRFRGYRHAYRSPEVLEIASKLACARSLHEFRRVRLGLTAAESDVWAFGVLALNLFEPRRLRSSARYSEEACQETLFDVRGEYAYDAFLAYCTKERCHAVLKKSGQEIKVWLMGACAKYADDSVLKLAAEQVPTLTDDHDTLSGSTLLDENALRSKLEGPFLALVHRLVDTSFERWPMPEETRKLISACLAARASSRPSDGNALLKSSRCALSSAFEPSAEIEFSALEYSERLDSCREVGMILVKAGLTDDAKVWFEEALRLAEYIKDEDTKCLALMAAAGGAAETGDYKLAVECLEKVVKSRTARFTKTHPLLVSVLCAVAMARNQLDPTAVESFKAYDTALLALRSLKGGPSLADVSILYAAAKAALAREQKVLAMDLAAQALELLAASTNDETVLNKSQLTELNHIIDPMRSVAAPVLTRSALYTVERDSFSGSDEYTTSGSDEADADFDAFLDNDLGGQHPKTRIHRLQLHHQLSKFAAGSAFDYQCLDYIVPVP